MVPPLFHYRFLPQTHRFITHQPSFNCMLYDPSRHSSQHENKFIDAAVEKYFQNAL
jgi:hypothetical protein